MLIFRNNAPSLPKGGPDLFFFLLLFSTLAHGASPLSATLTQTEDQKTIHVSLREKSCTGKKEIHWKKTTLASHPKTREKGLSQRKKRLSSQEAMLFIFSPPQRASFWMKNTHIPLGLLFFREDGSVAGHYLLRPEREPDRPQMVYTASEPVVAALEFSPSQLKNLEPQLTRLRLCIE